MKIKYLDETIQSDLYNRIAQILREERRKTSKDINVEYIKLAKNAKFYAALYYKLDNNKSSFFKNVYL